MKNDGRRVKVEQRTMGITVLKERAKSIAHKKSALRVDADGVCD